MNEYQNITNSSSNNKKISKELKIDISLYIGKSKIHARQQEKFHARDIMVNTDNEEKYPQKTWKDK